ncbi:hypothetical protein, partial [Paludisphaera rhizosphaerae]|uniref:hypothetical protein n=1 Tax=Paludisphaera rhizosphaerae TaxID=2711216 RepID=UPI001C6ED01D
GRIMNQQARRLLVGMGGFAAGMLVGRSTSISLVPKAFLVGMTTLIVATLLDWITRTNQNAG